MAADSLGNCDSWWRSIGDSHSGRLGAGDGDGDGSVVCRWWLGGGDGHRDGAVGGSPGFISAKALVVICP